MQTHTHPEIKGENQLLILCTQINKLQLAGKISHLQEVGQKAVD